MKDYFNSETRKNHLILWIQTEICDRLLKSDSLLDSEKRDLKVIKKRVENFTQSVFQRLGENYQKVFYNMARDNALTLAHKNITKDIVYNIDVKDLKNEIENLQISCIGCEKKEWKSCSIFAICQTIGIDGTEERNCPYRIDTYEK